MGTTKPGRVMNTKGSGRKPSEFALVHSSEGDFTKPSKKNNKVRLKAGGHSESNIRILEKYGVKYELTGKYDNGVRIGNVFEHKNKTKTKNSQQSWFPKDWTIKDIKKAGTHVAGLKNNHHTPDGKIMYGQYKGVRVGVIKTHGKIATIFPDVKQPGKLKKL